MNEQRQKREHEMLLFDETAGMTEEIYDSEDAATVLNVSERFTSGAQ